MLVSICLEILHTELKPSLRLESCFCSAIFATPLCFTSSLLIVFRSLVFAVLIIVSKFSTMKTSRSLFRPFSRKGDKLGYEHHYCICTAWGYMKVLCSLHKLSPTRVTGLISYASLWVRYDLNQMICRIRLLCLPLVLYLIILIMRFFKIVSRKVFI